ncbi:mechanosensitive ion channel [Kineosporia sp. J2-2]|uniref:Mechanosensitive ion channel n=1 Tax=Kineosporia corallincola TaxID=2835133 RepID=A0ABS5TS88_9ACTN|nr:mechanosensitive ion channel domain-containing protein [Kineosporia corallincola]MBT0773673.1 mechanosensitive ion channel [Kineosporia corallincola]
MWNQVSDAAHDGPDALTRLLLGAADTVLQYAFKAVVLLAVLLVLRLLAHRVIHAVANKIATSPWSSRWDLRALWRTPMPAQGQATERRRQRARAIASLLSHLTSAALAVTGVLVFVQGTGLSKAGVFTAGLVGVVAAVSFRGLANDIIAGLFVLSEDTYGIGDFIDTTLGAAGTVEEIGLRTTRLRGRDGTIWHVRHSKIDRLGNRTQAQSHLTLDIRAGFVEESPDKAPTLPSSAAGRLAAAERVVRTSLDRLDRDLASAAAPNPLDAGSMAGTLAEILPVLVPGAPHRALATLATATTSTAGMVDTAPLPFTAVDLDDLARLRSMLEDAQVPVLTRSRLAGLINAGDDHVVLRVSARVADTSREQALAVLRRRLYLDLNAAGFTASFSVPAPGEL